MGFPFTEPCLMPTHPQIVLILDFGSQVTQLIARRVREAKVYCEIHPYNFPLNKIRAMNPRGIILSGGPASVHAKGSPKPEAGIFGLGIPILGICYGMQLMGHMLGGKVRPAKAREFGLAEFLIDEPGALFSGLAKKQKVWMSHGDHVDVLPKGFRRLGHSGNSSQAAMADFERGFCGIQFHPEVNHTEQGRAMLANFLFKICACKPTWTMANFLEEKIREIKEAVGK